MVPFLESVHTELCSGYNWVLLVDSRIGLSGLWAGYQGFFKMINTLICLLIVSLIIECVFG